MAVTLRRSGNVQLWLQAHDSCVLVWLGNRISDARFYVWSISRWFA